MSQHNTSQQPYETDLTDTQWVIIEPLIPPSKAKPHKPGRRRETDMRQVVNAVF